MAHLLGSQNCLESLAVDISDVQDTIKDIFARVGLVRFPSWKYPDKASSDLDMAELLKRYCYSKDEEHSKLSHIILFELLIDRLVLLLQALSAFCNHLLTKTNNRPGTAKAVGSAMSVGLVVKKYWNKMAQLYQIVQRELTESNNKIRKVKSMEESMADMKQEIGLLQNLIKKKPANSTPVKGEIKNHSNRKTSAKFILSHTLDMNLESPSPSQDVTLAVEDVALTKTCQESATQTYDTAFVPCEACSRTQGNLIEVGQMVMKVCESQGLPSSLAKQKRLLKQSLLAAADVSRWAAEQNRDLSRINDHLDNLYAQIQPLQEKLSKSREKRKALEVRVKELENCVESEKTEAQKISEDFSAKLKEMAKEKRFLEEKTSEEITELNKRREFLETRIERSEKELSKSTALNSELELEREKMKSYLENEQLETSRLKNIEEELGKTKALLKETEKKLEKTTLELGKMEAKTRSLVKHDQALQGKHDALLQRIDELDQECEELREKVLDLEGEKDEVTEALNEAKNQSQSLTKELTIQQQQVTTIESDRDKLTSEIGKLENDVLRLQGKLRETEEKMQLIVEYPGDMDTRSITGKALDSPMAISQEMEKQISSNNIRIAMLEAQNEKLRHSIEKLASVNNQPRPKLQMDEPLQLWNPRHKRPDSKNRNQDNFQHSRITRTTSDSQTIAIRNGNGFSEGSRVPHSTDYRPRPPSNSKLDNFKTSNHSGREKLHEKRQARALSGKLAASSKTVAGMFQTGNKPRVADERHIETARDDASTATYEPMNTFVCGACDKMYTTRKDLDIHKAFCYELQA